MTIRSKWLLLFVLGSGAFAQEQPRFSANAQLVMLDVQVTEKGTGRVLDLLSPKDFEVYDEGVRRDVREFHFETAPVDFVFLFYGRSGLGTLRDRQEFNRGLNAAAAELRPGDRGAVLRTNSESKIDLQMSDDLEKVRHALVLGNPKYGRPGYDHLYDAVKAAATLFPRPKDPARRRAIVAITDDVERGSRITLDPLITELLESDATLNEAICVFGKQPSREIGAGGIWGIPRVSRGIGGPRTTGASLRDAVQATGGEAIPGDLFREKFPELMRRIRLRYLLGFYAEPAAQREFHRLDVRLTPEAQKQHPNALVRARRGYYSVPGASGNSWARVP